MSGGQLASLYTYSNTQIRFIGSDVIPRNPYKTGEIPGSSTLFSTDQFNTLSSVVIEVKELSIGPRLVIWENQELLNRNQVAIVGGDM